MTVPSQKMGGGSTNIHWDRAGAAKVICGSPLFRANRDVYLAGAGFVFSAGVGSFTTILKSTVGSGGTTVIA